MRATGPAGDYSRPSVENPLEVTCDPRYAPHSVLYDGEFIYLADQDHGFVILEYGGSVKDNEQ